MEQLSRAHWVTVALVAAITSIAVVSTFDIGPRDNSTRSFDSTDITEALAGVFHPGVILGAGSNQTDTLLTGIGVYQRNPEFTLPVLADLREGPEGPTVVNLTSMVNPYFFEGGTYGLGWNGTEWLVGGQATWGGVNDGTLVSIRGGEYTNLTALIYPYFAGGGIFAVGWNGTAWLVGGNSSAGIAIVAIEGMHVIDLTGEIPNRDPFGWVQLLAWNGAEWVIGGQGVFGTLGGRTYHDLLPASPFVGTGVFAAAWNGTAWLVGGTGARIVVIQSDALQPGPDLPSSFNQWVTLIANYPGGWLVAGKGSTPDAASTPELLSWDGSGGAAGVADLDFLIPGTFQGGEIQGGGWTPAFGPNCVVIVGDGSYSTGSGYGLGAMALLTLP